MFTSVALLQNDSRLSYENLVLLDRQIVKVKKMFKRKCDFPSPLVKSEGDTDIKTSTLELPSPPESKVLLIKRLKRDEEEETKSKQVKQTGCDWKHYQRENLSLHYTTLYDRKKATELIARCESEIVYNVGRLAQVQIFGKWIDIPRKQVAFGDPGLTYTFSGNTVPAKPWTPLLSEMRNDISNICGYDFNFVLVNRYQNGQEYMGEHKDDEKDLCPDHPIASLSLGQPRDFVFKHQDSRGKNAKRHVEKLTIQLGHGSLLMMNTPTNSFWYHSLPKRPKVLGMRLNFTFRKMVSSKCKPVKKYS